MADMDGRGSDYAAGSYLAKLRDLGGFWGKVTAVFESRSYVWNPVSLDWDRMTQPGGVGGGGGGPATIADGADVAEGITTDVAVTTDANGTVSGKLRGLVKWAYERMPASLGQKLMASSFPVVIASDQSSIPVAASAGTNLNTSALSLEATQALVKAKTDNLDVLLSTRTKPADQQHTIIDSGTIAALTDRTQKAQVTDGTRDGTVKAASTLPALTDTALVTTQRDPLPAGTNVIGHVIADSGSTTTVTGTVTVAQGTPPWTVKGDQARASATIPNPLALGLRAAAYPTKPASVAAGQLVDGVADLEGVLLTRPRQVATYTAIYRLALAAASSKLAFTFTANTDKQLATIYHAASATKRVTLRRVWVQIVSTGAVAGEVQLELRRLSATTAPATGNPVITASARDSSLAGAEATTLALPTTAGSEAAANSPLATWIGNFVASMQTVFTTGTVIPESLGMVKLYDEASADDEEIAPVMRAGIAEGFAIIGRSTAAVPLNFVIRAVFTEE